MTKQKSRSKIFVWIYRENIAEGNVLYFPLPGRNHLQSLTPKLQDFKRVLDLNCK